MATKIFDIDLGEVFEPHAGLEGYDRALFMIRSNGRPVGQVTVPVQDGQINPRTLRRLIDNRALSLAALAVVDKGVAEAVDPETIPLASIAICTRERPDDLRRALSSLVSPVPQGQEILVIDNCPVTDATRAVVAEFPAVRYVCEPRKGLDNARNRAIREARYEVLAFIDDDAVADPDWLRTIARTFADVRVACVTGLTMPLEMENEAQEKFEALAGFSKRGFLRREFRAPPMNPLATGAIGAGANMAIRRSVVRDIGPFDPALDAGTETQSGGDHEFFSRVLRAGHIIVYEPAALNWHRHRRTMEELRTAVYGYGVGVYASWTRSFLTERDWGVFRRAFGWLVHDQVPGLIRAYLHPSPDRPKDVLWAELRGCALGPFAYLKSRKRARGAERE
jgi:glycosyltransferase involved in cell wall biosynthesis